MEKLLAILKSMSKPKGMVGWLVGWLVGWFVMNPDDQNEWMGVAIFENEENYISNANSPEQNKSFRKLMEHLETEPDWSDGTYVISEIA